MCQIRRAGTHSYDIQALGNALQFHGAVHALGAEYGASLHVEYFNLGGNRTRDRERAAGKVHGKCFEAAKVGDGLLRGILGGRVRLGGVGLGRIRFSRVRRRGVLLGRVLRRLEILEAYHDAVERRLRFQVVIVDKAFLPVQAAKPAPLVGYAPDQVGVRIRFFEDNVQVFAECLSLALEVALAHVDAALEPDIEFGDFQLNIEFCKFLGQRTEAVRRTDEVLVGGGVFDVRLGAHAGNRNAVCDPTLHLFQQE